MKGPTAAETRSLEDCIDAIAHLAREGRAAGGLRPEAALEAIAVLATSLPEAQLESTIAGRKHPGFFQAVWLALVLLSRQPSDVKNASISARVTVNQAAWREI